MATKHAAYRAGVAVSETLKNLGNGAGTCLASVGTKISSTFTTGKNKPKKETADSNIGYGLRFTRNVAADAIGYVPIVGAVLETTGVLDWFVRHKDTQRLADLSPTNLHAKLDEYGECYDLKRFKELSETAIDSVHNSASHIMGNQTAINITTIDSLSKLLSVNDVAQKTKLNVVNETLSNCIPKTKLGDIQEKFNDVKRAIEKGEKPADPTDTAGDKLAAIHTPYEAANAFKNIYTVAKEQLKKEREHALVKLNELFAKTPDSQAEASVFKKNLVGLLDPLTTPATKDEIDALVSQHQQKIIDEVTKSYEKAENELKEQFEGKPATKGADGKDIAAVDGINEKADIAANGSKFDLISRIDAFEAILKLDPKFMLPNQEFSGTTGTDGFVMDPAIKKRCLRNLSREQINKLEFAGWCWGKRTRGDKLSDGTQLIIQENASGEVEVRFNVPGLWFAYHKATPEQLLKDMIQTTDIILAQGHVPTKITWQIDASTDELRNKLIVATCLAAHARGVDPKNVTLTVSGSQEKDKNFSKKTAVDPEVMQVLQAHGGEQVKAMLDDWKKQEKTIIDKKQALTQDFIKGGVSALREKKTMTAKELNKENDENQSQAANGPGSRGP